MTHPVDELIFDLIQRRRDANRDEVEQIRARLNTAPFSTQVVRAARQHRGLEYAGRRVEDRTDSGYLHLVRRVLVDRQWVHGTTMQQYLEDLQQLAIDPFTRLMVYDRGQGVVAAAFGPNRIPASRLGAMAQPYLLVIYSADRSSIITGYQVSELDQVGIGDEPLWLA